MKPWRDNGRPTVRSRFLILHNPHAGSGRHDLLRQVVAALRQAGCEVTIEQAPCDRTSAALAPEMAASELYDAVVAAGGDGTIRSIAAAMRGTALPVGLIPLGTGNVMAQELGMPRGASQIADNLRFGGSLPVRGAVANGTPFFLMAGAGLDGEAVAALNPRVKARWGKLAYVWPTTRAVLRRAPVIEAVLDGKTFETRWIVICKAGRYAGGFRLSPDSSVFRPGLVAVFSTAETRAGLITDIFAIGAGYAKSAPHLHAVPLRHAVIRAKQAVPVQVDGECFGHLPLTITEDSQTVNLLTPLAPAAETRAHARAAA